MTAPTSTHDLTMLRARREAAWCQTPARKLRGPDDARPLIERVGITTLFPASPEVPNLYHAYMGDPAAKTEMQWDTPSGRVYTWRWTLGRAEAAFYGVLVRKRPTHVAWGLLPAALRLWSDLRMPDELEGAGVLSPDALRIAHALDAAGGALSTGDLRRESGFPTGKDQRSAFLKAIAELDARLMLGRTFVEGAEDAMHVLIVTHYREQAEAAERLTAEQALDAVLRAYLPAAAYAVPTVLARHVGLAEADLRAGLDRLVEAGQAERADLSGQKGTCYIWCDG